MEKKHVTENGINVYSYQNRKIGSFAISLFLRCGMIYENEKENGFAHFFEHAVFRNINALMNGELYGFLDKNGLDFNAVTHINYVEFTIGGAAAHFLDAARVISYALSPIVLGKSELDAEKKRIKSEIREEGEGSLERFADKTVYAQTPMERTILGTVKNVDSFGVKMMKRKLTEFLSRENIFFYVGGNFSDKSIERFYDMISAHQIYSAEKRSNTLPLPAGFGKRDCSVVVKNAQSTEICLSFDVFNNGYSVQELLCLCDTLFLGESCPMYRELSENRGLIYSYSDNICILDDFSVISVVYEVRADKLYQSIETVFEMLKKAKTGSSARLEYVLPFFTDDGDIMMDDSEKIVSDFGYYNHILGLGYTCCDDMKAAFGNVDGEKLNVLASLVFTSDNLVVALKGNKNKINTQRIKNLAKQYLG